MTPVAYAVCYIALPDSFWLINASEVTGRQIQNWKVFVCIACGLWSGLIIGYITEYFTSFSYQPVRDCADACKSGGAATNIIYGLALGYKSTIIPVFCIAVTIVVSHSLAGMYGVASAALGILSTLPTGLAIDGYGPICDNAGGLAEMACMPAETRERTDALDAAGNTTAAIGKGFAIGSAALVSLALFGAFITSKNLAKVDILEPFAFAGLLLGAMLPYWFSAMTMRSVGEAAKAMVEEVSRQLLEEVIDEHGNKRKVKTDVCKGLKKPDYAKCVAISTSASLHEMIAPGALVILTPIFFGFLFGVNMLAGVLAGCLTSGVQIAISASNSGGAWDNTKKYISGVLKEKGTDHHKASVIGDTVGDPLKDTSGPSLNILIKLTAIISVVTASAMPNTRYGLLGQLFGDNSSL
jgi:inorganic pyrophosphatase